MKPTTHAIHPRPTFSKAVSSASDTDRLFRFIERLGGWQCSSCHELYPAPQKGIDGILHGKICGVCPDCFQNNEDVMDVLEMPKSDWDLWVLRKSLYREGNVFSYLAPYRGINTTYNKVPLSYNMLCILDSIIEMDRVIEMTTKYGSDGEKAFDTSATRWHEHYGIVPIRISEFPPIEDTKSWKEIWQANPVFVDRNSITA